jgi:peptidoglycan/xylan/chitin deacetylase (PgdA/CDA1 family)
MHNGAKYTTEALPKVLEGLESKGYEIVLISELIYKDNYEINVEGRQYMKSKNK